ncbi:MAG: DUF3999 domain-containing protein [Deferribacteraceae bacterium]|nr:DUF3999 domain-containing protein [Deferribacteraceae bacterium]
MRILSALSILILLMSGAVFATEQSEYGFGANVEGEFNADGVYVFSVPLQVYERVTDRKLSDIALFNSAGERVPFTLVRPKPSSYTAPADEQITFEKEKYESDNKTYIKHLIADINELSGTVSKLRFLYNGNDFSGKISIYYSTGDLGNFSTAAYSVTLAKLGNIIQDSADVSNIPKNATYLRLTGDFAALDAISGAVISFKAEPVYDRIEKMILNGSPIDDRLLDFKLPGYFPVEFISLKTAEAYLFKEVAINTAELDNQSAVHYKQLTDYSVVKGISGYFGENARTRRIRIAFEDPLPAETAANFYWRADELIFIAKGDAPFTLVYGNIAEKGKSSVSYEELAKRSGEAVRTELSSGEIVFAGESALISPPEEKRTARKAALLAFMVLVVLIVSAVSVRLLIKGSNG